MGLQIENKRLSASPSPMKPWLIRLGQGDSVDALEARDLELWLLAKSRLH